MILPSLLSIKTQSRKHVLAPSDLVEYLSLDVFLSSDAWTIHAVEPETNVEQLLEFIKDYSDQEIHLICHGDGVTLQIGEGLPLSRLYDSRRDCSSVSTPDLVLWSCYGGLHYGCSDRARARIITTDSLLGNNKTIEGYAPLSSLVQQSSVELNDKSAGWTSKNKELFALHPPNQNSKTGIWHLDQDNSVNLLSKISQNKLIVLPKLKEIRSEITSEYKDFREWTIRFDAADPKLTFRFPKILRSKDSGKSDLLTTEVTVEDASIKSWYVEASADLLDIDSLKISGKVNLSHEIGSSRYILGGVVDLFSDSPIAEYFDFGSQKFDGQVVFNHSARKNKTRDRFHVVGFEGKTPFEIDLFGLGGLKSSKKSSIAYSKSQQASDTDNNVDGRYTISHIKTTGGRGSIFNRGVKLPNLNFNLLNGAFKIGKWKTSGKLSFNIPGLNTNKKIDISSQSSNSNQQEIKIRNLKLPNNQPLFENGAAINSLAVTQDENGIWYPKAWSARGDFKLPFNALKFAPDLRLNYKKSADGDLISLKNASILNDNNQLITSGSISNADLSKGPNNKWLISSLKANGELTNLLKPVGIDLNPSVAFSYSFDPKKSEELYELSGSLVSNSKASSLLGNGSLDHLHLVKPNKDNDRWTISNWQATGSLNIKPIGLSIDKATLRYNNDGGISTYSIRDLKLSKTGDQSNLLEAGTLRHLEFQPIQKGRGWKISEWEAEGNFNQNIAGLALDAGLTLAFDDNDKDSFYTISNAVLKTNASATNNNLLLSSGRLDELVFSYSPTNKGRILDVKHWNATGRLNVDVLGLSIDGLVDMSFSTKNNKHRYIIEKAQLSTKTDSSLTNQLMGDGEIRDLILIQDKISKKPAWTIQQYEAEGSFALNLPGLNVQSKALLSYQNTRGAQTYRVDRAMVGGGSKEDDLFSAGTVNDLVFEFDSTNNQWDVKSFEVDGRINLPVRGVELNSKLSMKYDKNKGRAKYFIAEAEIDASTDKQGADHIFAKATINDLIFIDQSNDDEEHKWHVLSYAAIGQLDFSIAGLPLGSDVNLEYKSTRASQPQYVINADFNAGQVNASSLFAEGRVQDLILRPHSDQVESDSTDKRSASWIVDSYTASGRFNFDIAGLKFNSNLDLDYKRGDDPNSIDLYRVSEASLQASKEDQSALFAEAKLRDLVIHHLPNKTGRDAWKVQKYKVNGLLNIDIAGLNLSSDVELKYRYDALNSRDLYSANARVSADTTDSESLFTTADITNLQFSYDQQNQINPWQVDQYDASGMLAMEVLGLNLSSGVDLTYRRESSGLERYTASASITAAGDDPNSLFATAEVEDMEFSHHANPEDAGDSWTVDKFRASGQLSFGVSGLNLSSGVDVNYSIDKSGDPLFIVNASIKTKGTQSDSLFGRAEVSDLFVRYREPLEESSVSWLVEQFDAEGELEVPILGLNFNGNVALEYRHNITSGIDNYRINGKVSAASQDAESIFAKATVSDLLLSRNQNSPPGKSAWRVDQFDAAGELNFPVAGLNFTSDVQLSYRNPLEGSEQYILNADVGGSADSDSLFASAKVTDMIIEPIVDPSARNSRKWAVRQYKASGALSFNVSGLSFASAVNLEYQNVGNLETFTIPAASLKSSGSSLLASGRVENLTFTRSRSTPSRSDDVSLPSTSTWSTEQWDASGALNIAAPGLNLSAGASVSYRSDSQQYLVSAQLESASDLLQAGASLDQMVVKKSTVEGATKPWLIEQWTASGSLNLDTTGFQLDSSMRIQFLSDLLSPTGRDIYKVSGGLSFEAGLFNGDVSLNEMLIEPTSQKDWAISSWNASGLLDIKFGGLSASGSIAVDYLAGVDGKPDSYVIDELTLASSGDFFSGQVSAQDVNLTYDPQHGWIPLSAKLRGSLAADFDLIGLQGDVALDYSYDPVRKTTVWKTSDATSADLKLAIKDFADFKTSVQFERVIPDSSLETPYFKSLSAGLDQGKISIGDLDFDIPKQGVEFAYAQNPIVVNGKTELETIYGVNGSFGFDLVDNFLAVDLEAGSGSIASSMRQITDDDYFSSLRNSAVKNNTWNVGTISGSASFNGQSGFDLGLAKIGSLGVSNQSKLPDGKSVPLGLYKYNGPTRTDQTGLASDLTVEAKDITLRVGALANGIQPLAKSISNFVSPLKEPIDYLKKDILGGFYDGIDERTSWIIGKANSVLKYFPFDASISHPYLGRKIESKIGNSASDIIDSVYEIRYNKKLHLSDKLDTARTFLDQMDAFSRNSYVDRKVDGLSFAYTIPSHASSIQNPTPSSSVGVHQSSQSLRQTVGAIQPAAHPALKSTDLGLSLPVMDKRFGTYLEYPAFASSDAVKSMLKTFFTQPDQPIDIFKFGMGLNIDNLSFDTPNLLPNPLSLKLGAGIGFDLKTQAGMQISGSDIFELMTADQVPSVAADLFSKNVYLDLDNTSASIRPEFNLSAGLELVPEGPVRSACDNWVQKNVIKYCGGTPGYALGASLDTKLSADLTVQLDNASGNRVYLDQLDSMKLSPRLSFDGLTLSPNLRLNYIFGTQNYSLGHVEVLPAVSIGSKSPQTFGVKQAYSDFDQYFGDRLTLESRRVLGSSGNDRYVGEDGVIDHVIVSAGKDKLRRFNPSEGDRLIVSSDTDFSFERAKKGLVIDFEDFGTMKINRLNPKTIGVDDFVLNQSDIV